MIQMQERLSLENLGQGPKYGLWEADGGAWRMTAMSRIRDWLQVQVGDLENVHVIA